MFMPLLANPAVNSASAPDLLGSPTSSSVPTSYETCCAQSLLALGHVIHDDLHRTLRSRSAAQDTQNAYFGIGENFCHCRQFTRLIFKRDCQLLDFGHGNILRLFLIGSGLHEALCFSVKTKARTG